LNYLIKLIPYTGENEQEKHKRGSRIPFMRDDFTLLFRQYSSSWLYEGWIGAVAMKMIGEGLLGEYRRAKSDVQRSNGNSSAIYARLGTMHHASRCCRYAGEPCTASTHRTGCSTVWAMHWPICRSSPKSRRFTVEPGRAIDAGSCIRNLRSFACHGIDEIKTVGKNSGVTILVFPLLWHVAHHRTNCPYFCLTNHAPRTIQCVKDGRC